MRLVQRKLVNTQKLVRPTFVNNVRNKTVNAEIPDLNTSQAKSIARQHSMASAERFAKLLQRGIQINPGLSREMSEEYFKRDHSFDSTTSMLLLKCGSCFGPNKQIPYDVLMLLTQAEYINRDTQGALTICIIGHSLAQIENPGMTFEQSEQNSRYAFSLLRLLDNLKCFFPSISPVLDTDLMATKEYKEAKSELRNEAEGCAKHVFEMAVLSLTVQKLYGVALKFGWSSFANTHEYIAVRKGLAPTINKVSGCHLAGDLLIKGRLAFIYCTPGTLYSNFDEPKLAEPDVVRPNFNTRRDAQRSGDGADGRLYFNPRFAYLVDNFSTNPYSVDDSKLKRNVIRERKVERMLAALRELAPEAMPVVDKEVSDLKNCERVLELCRTNVKVAAAKVTELIAAQRELGLAVRAYYDTLSRKNSIETKFIISEYGVEANGIARILTNSNNVNDINMLSL